MSRLAAQTRARRYASSLIVTVMFLMDSHSLQRAGFAAGFLYFDCAPEALNYLQTARNGAKLACEAMRPVFRLGDQVRFAESGRSVCLAIEGVIKIWIKVLLGAPSVRCPDSGVRVPSSSTIFEIREHVHLTNRLEGFSLRSFLGWKLKLPMSDSIHRPDCRVCTKNALPDKERRYARDGN